jgi:hypothetical protein
MEWVTGIGYGNGLREQVTETGYGNGLRKRVMETGYRNGLRKWVIEMDYANGLGERVGEIFTITKITTFTLFLSSFLFLSIYSLIPKTFRSTYY